MRSPQGYGSNGCSPETRAKIAASQAGELGANWHGEQIGYSGIHKRARKVLPLVCSQADASCCGHIEVALRHDAVGPFGTDKRGEYSKRVEDYWTLCRSHHNRYDGKEPPPETRMRAHRAVARS